MENTQSHALRVPGSKITPPERPVFKYITGDCHLRYDWAARVADVTRSRPHAVGPCAIHFIGNLTFLHTTQYYTGRGE